MKKIKYNAWSVIYWCVVTLLITLFLMLTITGKVSIESFDKGYKQGQIDALNGIQNYDKIITKDTIYFKIR